MTYRRSLRWLAPLATTLSLAAFTLPSFGAVQEPDEEPKVAPDERAPQHGAAHGRNAPGARQAEDEPTFARPEDGEPAEHAEDEEDDHAPPKAINWTDFSNTKQPPYAALALNFIFLLGIYFYYGKKPVADGLKRRRAEIAKEIEEAQRMKEEAEARAKMYQAKLGKLEGELVEARQALVDAGKGEKERIIREAEERAERLRSDAKLLLEQELAQLRNDLVRETVTVAVQAAEEMLRASVTPADQERLAEDFLKDLSLKPRAAATVPPAALLGGAS